MIYTLCLFATSINKSKEPDAPKDLDKEKAKEQLISLKEKLLSMNVVHRGCIVIQVDRSDSDDDDKAPKLVEKKYFVVKLYDQTDINLDPEQSSSLSLFISGTGGTKSLQYSDKQMVIARA